MVEFSQGQHGDYLWVARPLDPVDTSRPLATLVRACPETLLNKYLVVTSLDSSPLQLNSQQLNRGWLRSGRLAISPKISDPAEAPYQWFDEWYLFDALLVPDEVEVFVNHGTFSLGDPYPAIRTMYIGSDTAQVDRMAQAVFELRRRFWMQIERIQPVSYVSNGNSFIFVTQEHDSYERLIAALAVA